MAKITSPFTLTFKSLKKQFITKEKLVKSSLVIQKKNIEDKRKNSERESRISYENKLERTLSFLGRPVKTVGKKLGFLDSIRQFIVNVLLGFIAVRLLKYLPQLMNVFKVMLKVGDFILDMSGKLLNGLVTFVDKGYQAADNARKLVGKIGGEKAINALDEASNQTNSLLNSIAIAGMLFSDFGGIGMGSIASGKAIDAGVDIIEDQVKKQAVQQAANQAAKQGLRAAVGPMGATAIVIGAGLLASAVGEGAFQIKKLGRGLQGWIVGKLTESSQDKNPVTRFLKKGFFGWMNATLGPAIWLLNGTGVLFDVVGAPFRYGIELIRAAVMKLNDDRKGLEEQNKNLGKFDARVRDGIREHFSVLSPLFNLMGMKGVSQKLQTPGSFGSLYGEKAARDIGYYRGGVVKKFAGGGYTRSVGDENKKAEIPRTFNASMGGIDPGSAVGGSFVVTKVFPYQDKNGVMDQYSYLKSSYGEFGQVNSLGSLMQLTTKVVLGDKITDKDYSNIGDSLSIFLLNGIKEENPQAFNQISSVLGTDKLGGIIKGELVKILNDKFNQIQGQLRLQLGLKELKSSEGFSPTSEDCACPESDQQFVATGNQYEKALLETISQVEGTSGPDGYRTMFGGGKFQAPPWRHPDTVVRSGGYASAAAGKYQFMPGTWANAAKALGLSDFSPANQDKAALWLAKGRGVNPSAQLTVADFEKLGREWAGLSPHYGQTSRTASQSYNIYLEKLKSSGATSTTAKISPSSPAANVSDCVCDPEVPDATNIGGQVQPAGETAGATVSGYPITSRFGWRWGRNHGGIDVGAPSGKPIAIRAPGEVVFAGYAGGYGNVVDIWVPSLRQMFRMAHMRDTPSVKTGQTTAAGQLLGYVGSTGNSTGPHVHFESHDTKTTAYGNKDPMPYINYLTIGREYGGPTLSGGIRLLHKGEYVIDKDSVDLFGGIPFFSLINNVENESQRAQKSSQLIQHLSKYTGRKIDQRPEVIVENDEDTVVMSPPVYVQSPSSGSYGGETPNYEQDMCYARG
jgi:murein DD-endopeptidase MepM/ murein hydrolase activator NlpD